MNKIKQFNNFQTSYKRLIEQPDIDLLKINIQYYHHDFQSEPFLHVEAEIDHIIIEHVEDHGLVISILTPETTFSFSERNYNTNLSNDAVVFSSKYDEETYCIIELI